MSLRRPVLVFSLALLLPAVPGEPRVVRLTIERREPVLAGRPFGLAGPYETLSGTLELALDPTLRQKRTVVDLHLAPRNDRGEVVFTAEFSLLKPVDLRRGNGRVYYEVPNRGGKGILRRLQYAEASLDPCAAADFGDAWLLEQGFSIAWMGWQWDVPERPGLLRLRAPIATTGRRPIEGLARAALRRRPCRGLPAAGAGLAAAAHGDAAVRGHAGRAGGERLAAETPPPGPA